MKKTYKKATLRLLKKSKQSVPQIARATGLGERWLYRLKNGDYENPGVDHMQTLREYLDPESAES